MPTRLIKIRNLPMLDVFNLLKINRDVVDANSYCSHTAVPNRFSNESSDGSVSMA